MIHLVRHGQTEYNRDGIGFGRADVELTDLGRRQAAAVAARFAGARVARVVTSPLLRAFVVAEHIAREHGIDPERMDALTELDVGETEGLAFAEMRSRFPEFLAKWAGDDGWKEPMPGGESIHDLSLRLDPLVHNLLAESSDADIVVVSHNFTLRVLMCRLLGLEASRFRSFEIGLAAATTVSFRGGRLAVHSINDECHVSNLNLA